ncbi:MAG: hypothetical protein AAF583_11155 [Pseudomonadota bacterium]
MTPLPERLMLIGTELNAIKDARPEFADLCDIAWECIQQMEVEAKVGQPEPAPGMEDVRADLAEFNKKHPVQGAG